MAELKNYTVYAGKKMEKVAEGAFAGPKQAADGVAPKVRLSSVLKVVAANGRTSWYKTFLAADTKTKRAGVAQPAEIARFAPAPKAVKRPVAVKAPAARKAPARRAAKAA